MKVDEYFPSSKRRCSCGHVVEKLPLNITDWDCPECASHHDRDINAHFKHFGCWAGSVARVTVFMPKESKSRRVSAMKQKAPNSHARVSRAVL
ncbi:MAG: transposase [Trichodesmium sp. MAG_R02]|nr:transposase [Trichodesmium sp. MAG_R02]